MLPDMAGLNSIYQRSVAEQVAQDSYFVSEDASFVTGQLLFVCEGMSVGSSMH